MLLLLLFISCSAAIPILADYAKHPGANIITESKKEIRQAAVEAAHRVESYGYEMVGNALSKKAELAWARILLVRFLRWMVSFLS
jgi:hypothetical protein